jgi:hypothetical protein
VVSPYGTDDPTRIVPGSSYGNDADATRLVSGGSRGAVPAGAASDVYALGAILWTALLGYPPEVGPGDTAGPDLGPLRNNGAPTDLALLLQSMLAASAPLRPSAAVAANRFAALGIEARETRSDPLPTAVLGAGAAGVGVGEATRAVGPLRMRDDDDDYVPPGGGSGSGSGRKAGIAIGVALLVVLAGVAIALVLSHNSNNNTPTGTSSVTAPTNSAGQISVSSAPSTSAAATTTSAAATTTSAAATTTSAAPTTTSASPSPVPDADRDDADGYCVVEPVGLDDRRPLRARRRAPRRLRRLRRTPSPTTTPVVTATDIERRKTRHDRCPRRETMDEVGSRRHPLTGRSAVLTGSRVRR